MADHADEVFLNPTWSIPTMGKRASTAESGRVLRGEDDTMPLVPAEMQQPEKKGRSKIAGKRTPTSGHLI